MWRFEVSEEGCSKAVQYGRKKNKFSTVLVACGAYFGKSYLEWLASVAGGAGRKKGEREERGARRKRKEREKEGGNAGTECPSPWAQDGPCFWELFSTLCHTNAYRWMGHRLHRHILVYLKNSPTRTEPFWASQKKSKQLQGMAMGKWGTLEYYWCTDRAWETRNREVPRLRWIGSYMYCTTSNFPRMGKSRKFKARATRHGQQKNCLQSSKFKVFSPEKHIRALQLICLLRRTPSANYTSHRHIMRRQGPKVRFHTGPRGICQKLPSTHYTVYSLVVVYSKINASTKNWGFRYRDSWNEIFKYPAQHATILSKFL